MGTSPQISGEEKIGIKRGNENVGFVGGHVTPVAHSPSHCKSKSSRKKSETEKKPPFWTHELDYGYFWMPRIGDGKLATSTERNYKWDINIFKSHNELVRFHLPLYRLYIEVW